MRKSIPFYILLALTLGTFAQQPYYNDVDITKTGQDLYFELQNKIDIASNTFTYDNVKDALLVVDEDPSNQNRVLLIYGYSDDSNCTTDRSRLKTAFGGGLCEYNREHVFARSLANPSMGDVNSTTTGIGADPHNLRASDQQMNNNKGNKLFAPGAGNAGDVGSGNWYPGDEWKGDVARMMMYMYTRYGARCLPSLTGIGPKQGSTQMLQLFLQWNVEDPVSSYEDQRNPYTENVYGNRNPFIDNPYLATVIWGGPAAEDRWNILATNDFINNTVSVYPNPASEIIWIQNTTQTNSNYILYDISGRIISTDTLNGSVSEINVEALTPGTYLLQLTINNTKVYKRIVIK